MKYIRWTAFFLSLLAWTLSLLRQGYISLPFGIFALIALLILRAIGGNRWIVLVTFDIGITIASFLTALVMIADIDNTSFTGYLLAAFLFWLLLIWIYYKVFGPIYSIQTSIAIFLGPIIWLIPLLSTGYIPLLLGLVIALALIIFRVVGRRKGWRSVFWIFAFGIPIASLIISSSGDSHLVFGIIQLVIVLLGLFILVSGLFSSRGRN